MPSHSVPFWHTFLHLTAQANTFSSFRSIHALPFFTLLTDQADWLLLWATSTVLASGFRLGFANVKHGQEIGGRRESEFGECIPLAPSLRGHIGMAMSLTKVTGPVRWPLHKPSLGSLLPPFAPSGPMVSTVTIPCRPLTPCPLLKLSLC